MFDDPNFVKGEQRKMKKWILAAFVVMAASSYAQAQDKGFGLGIILGEPTGISGKYWLSTTTALDGGAAWNFGSGGFLHIHADYLFHNYDLIKVQEGRLPVYFGIGGRIGFSSKTVVGLRGVVGVAYQFSSAPLDAFLELAPIMDLVPGTSFHMNGGIGMRFFF
jgi:hypothetical protein